jgi:hypothetical protein
MDRSIQASEDPLPLMLLLARRVRLSQYCASPSGCPEPIADDLQPDYALMLDPQRIQQPPAQELAKLKATYNAYVSWQQPAKAELQQDLDEDHKRLQRWLSARQFALDRLLLWVNRRSPPITYEQYWELPPPLTTVAAPQIEAACTKKAWEQDIAAFLQQIQDAVPDVSPQLRTFQQQFITSCLDQWHRFLVDFPQGADRWKGTERRQALASRLLTENSPYQRVIGDAWTNISSWLPAKEGSGSTPVWAEQLRSYAASEQKKTYQEALKQISTRLEGDSLPEAAFKVVRDAFAEGKPTEEATNPVQRAWLLATQFSQAGGGGQNSQDGNVLPPLLQEPIRYVWRVILEQSTVYLQKTWADNVLTPLAGMPPAERLAALYGPGGKVGIFTEQFLKPLLSGNAPLGEKVTLPPNVAKTLDEEKQLKPLLGGNTTYSIQVRAGRRSDIEGSSPLLEDQTILSISCAGKVYRLTTRPHEITDTEATVQWSYQGCGDVTLTVYFYFFDREQRLSRERKQQEKAPTEITKRIQLTKRYSGSSGFLRFLQDFTKGSHRFQINEFDPDPEAGAVLQDGVNFIDVYYSVNVPPPLEKLTTALQSPTPRGESSSRSDPVT